ncbi:MAG: hypothetical protein WAX89_03445 [Alphaproteobacteria bacterium]
MAKIMFAAVALVVAGCSDLSCKAPSLYEPIDACHTCEWNVD